MTKIPEFMLKALYVHGSLRNSDNGFEFQPKNELGPARIVGALPLMLNRKPVPLSDCSFVHGEEEVAFESVTAENPVLRRKGEAVSVKVGGLTLQPRRHTLDIGVIVKDMGELCLKVSDGVH